MQSAVQQADWVRERYQNYVNPALAAMLEQAKIRVVEGKSEDCYIYGADGQKYIDCLGGYGMFSLGHRHAEVVAAVERQLAKEPQASHIFYNPVLAEASERLAKTLGWTSCGSFFCNSGAEAVEGALKLARLYTGRKNFVAMKNAFHGKTFGALSATGRELYQKGVQPLLDGFTHIPFDDLEAARQAVDESVAAVIVEAVQGEGGIIVPRRGYLAALAALCREKGALLICDEVQCGLGRTGRMFGYERDGVAPDIVVLAKALGGGVMPVGAFAASQEIWRPLIENPLLHTSTFGGGALACAAASAALCVLERDYESFCVAAKGEFFLRGLRAWQRQYGGVIRETRGLGLMLGVEFTEEIYAMQFMQLCLQQHILVAYTLNNPAVVRFEPPFTITRAMLEEVLSRIEGALPRVFCL